MSRNLDSTLKASLPGRLVQPVRLVAIRLRTGWEYIWSGVGDLVWNGHTFQGVGSLGVIGPIAEDSTVKADGTTITLSGIGLSALDIPASGITPPAFPRATAAGESAAWSYATLPPSAGSFSIPPTTFNAHLGISGSSGGTATTGFVTLTNGDSFDSPNSMAVGWGGFGLPPEVPVGAVITGVYPVFVFASLSAGGYMLVQCGSASAAPAGGTQVLGDQGALSGQVMGASILNSVPGAASLSMYFSFVGMAIYYLGTPNTKLALLREALGDIQLGAPVKIWYGHWASDALLGTPYLQFAGTVDKPTAHTGVDTISIQIALENRLTNLQRPSNRRYTAADQHLAYPDDTAFNWVETLNDKADRWGN